MTVTHVILLLIAMTIYGNPSGNDSVKVFVLAGQSNMQGHGKVTADASVNKGSGSLEWLCTRPDAAEKYRQWIDSSGQWVERNDVQIHFLDRVGNLQPGFGFREGFIGPELGFGQVVGDACDEPVLLVKIAWGGKSLAEDFRPPSSGGETGFYYKELIRRVKEAISESSSQYPGAKLELTGFGWHQGWNDRINQAFNEAYESNLANFIRDVRRDLGARDLPFVVAETGMNGRDEVHPKALSLMKAQHAVSEYEEFKGNVAFVGTRDFFRPEAESPSGQGYHWNSNAETYYLIGEGMGQAMLKLLQKK